MFQSKKRFTLIELLVVIAIIAILAAILMPALSQARERGRTATCINNMKSFGLAIANYADDFTTYPWPGRKGWWGSNSNIWTLLTGLSAGGDKKYSASYIAADGARYKIGNRPALKCPSHDGQHNNHTTPTPVAHYMFLGSSSWQVSGGSYGMTSDAGNPPKTQFSTAPQQVKSPAIKIAMVERSLENFTLSDYSYVLTDRNYLYGSTSGTNKVGPVHNGKGSGLHYDGHVSMLDMEVEFYCSSSNRGNDIFKRYFNTRAVY